MIKVSVTDSLGLAVFDQVREGAYLIRVSVVNYTPQYTALFQLPLSESSGQLAGIVLEKGWARVIDLVIKLNT